MFEEFSDFIEKEYLDKSRVLRKIIEDDHILDNVDLKGQWSIDFLMNSNIKAWLIDMAVAQQSAYCDVDYDFVDKYAVQSAQAMYTFHVDGKDADFIDGKNYCMMKTYYINNDINDPYGKTQKELGLSLSRVGTISTPLNGKRISRTRQNQMDQKSSDIWQLESIQDNRLDMSTVISTWS